jgi:hypothetical protein
MPRARARSIGVDADARLVGKRSALSRAMDVDVERRAPRRRVR